MDDGTHFLDTNILFYSISRDPSEAARRERAIALLEQDDGTLSVQVLQEFYVQATRATRPDPLPHDIAAGLIASWTRFRVQEITLSILTGALEIRNYDNQSLPLTDEGRRDPDADDSP